MQLGDRLHWKSTDEEHAMQLTRQEDLLLDRMAAHMVASGNMDIDAAVEAVRAQDKALLTKLIALEDAYETIVVGDYQYEGAHGLSEMRNAMGRRVYKNIRARSKPLRDIPPIESGRVVKISGGHGPDRSILYRVDRKSDVYVSLSDLQLHIAGMCKEDCPRCALQHLIDA